MEIILEAKNIVKKFKNNKDLHWGKTQFFTAVDHVSVQIPKQSTIGVVGESGSGKSTFGEVIGDLQKPTAGTVCYFGKDINKLSKKEYKQYRRNVQFIFQNAKESLNPFFTIQEVLLEPLKVLNENFDRDMAIVEIKNMLKKVNLNEKVLLKYPKELSGGQAQRVAIARALLLKPEVIISDESVSALDVSVQKQILDLLKELQKEFNTSYLFITHDIGVVNYMADYILVMKNGKVVEEGTKEQILFDPQHEYTKTLISSSFLFSE